MNVENKNIVVLYHANCLDGFAAAYACWKKFDNEADYLPVQYDEEPPEGLEGKIVYIVDFSYSLEQLLVLCAKCAEVIVIDHHKTSGFILANLELINKINYRFIWVNIKSGCVLTWEYFFPYVKVPEALLAIQDRDLWKFELPNTEKITTFFANEAVLKRTFKDWNWIITTWNPLEEHVVHTGKLLVATFSAQVKELAEKSYICSVDMPKYNLRGLAVNAPAMFASELGNLLASRSETYGAVWSYLGGGKYKVSLRSIGDFDVEVIAKYFGGGGHKNAAGFYFQRGLTGETFHGDILQECSNG